MRSTRATERALVVAAAGLMTIGGCTGALPAPIPTAHPADEAPRQGGTLHLASLSEITTLDPPLASDTLTTSVLRLMYAGLVDLDAHGNVVPDLASRIETLDEGVAFRFTLREGVRFHDGSEVTADDVKRSIERALAPTTACATAGFYDAIAGFDDYTAGTSAHLAGVVVEGRYVVTIHLRDRDASFLSALAMGALRVTCPSAGDRLSVSWTPCGAGPFRLPPGGWEHGRTLTLVRNESYFRPGLPLLDGVTWQWASSPISQSFKFSRGDLDVARELIQSDLIRYRADARWAPFGALETTRSMQGDSMNTELPPFDNVEIRRAVAAAIDRDHLVMLASSNLVAVTKPVPPGLPGYDPEFEGQRFDRDAALFHMKKAGYPFNPTTGQGGWPEPIVYDVARATLQELAAQSMQQDLARVGLRVELRVSSLPTLYAITHRRGRSQMSPQGWQEDFPDPSDFLDLLFSSKSINDQDTLNYAFYRSPVVYESLVRAKRERDPATRARIYEETERRICDDAPWAFEWGYRFFQVNQPYVHGLHTHPIWIDDVVGTWLDREADGVARRDAPFVRTLLAGLGGTR